MKNKMKVIDLLNKIANDELEDKTEFIIKTHNTPCIYHKEDKKIEFKYKGDWDQFIYSFAFRELNNEIEIIEEVKKTKKIDKIIIEYDNKDEQCKLAYMNACYELSPQEVIMLDKIEELRNVINYLLEKSDKE